MTLVYATKSASYRTNTEDRILVVQLDAHAIVVVCADGAGGIGGGGLAADLAVEAVKAKLAATEFDLWSQEAWCREMVELDRLVEVNPKAGETTLVVVVVGSDDILVGASVGDSEAKLFTTGGRIDDLTFGQQRHRKRRLGSGRAVPVGFSRKRWTGTLVVASDGLWGYARPERVGQEVLGGGALDEIGERLVKCVRLPSGDLMDDVAAVLISTGSA